MTQEKQKEMEAAVGAAIRLIDNGYEGLARDVLVDAVNNEEDDL